MDSRISSIWDFTPEALGELKAWLEPWFHSIAGGGGGSRAHDLIMVIDGSGSAITTGVKGDVAIDFGCTITQATVLADQSGSIVLDVWKAPYTSFPPTVSNTITASAKPTLASAIKAQDSTLTGWTTAVAAGDTFRLHVDSVSTVTRIALMLKLVST